MEQTDVTTGHGYAAEWLHHFPEKMWTSRDLMIGPKAGSVAAASAEWRSLGAKESVNFPSDVITLAATVVAAHHNVRIRRT